MFSICVWVGFRTYVCSFYEICIMPLKNSVQINKPPLHKSHKTVAELPFQDINVQLVLWHVSLLGP